MSLSLSGTVLVIFTDMDHSQEDKLGMLAFLLAEEVDVVMESPHMWHFQV